MSVILSGCSTEDNETSTSQNPDPVNNNPTVITAASLVIENTGANGITVSFSVSEEGSGSGITEVGVVWSSNPNPTINDNKVSYSSAGSYRSQLAFLNDDTTYYMRSYGTNSGGTIYGTESSISTLPTSQALVYDGDITLTSQQEVIDFGYQNYSKVTGTLAIWGYNYIDSLTPLQTILRVNKLDISGCLGLENLNGLEHLHTIDGSLTIFANEGLLNFNGLNSLTEIGDELDIHNNAHLISISNLLSLTNIPGNLKVVNNDQLPNLQGLQQIDSVGGVVKV
ncbi:MAG: hypothetical protein HKP11_12840, partial [Flavobacteriaceae bacterium]|nr:hypothetical protein [Flavobacteriaceae bacterium]